MRKVGGVNPLVGPAAHSIGYTKCDVAAVACPAHEESILAAVWPSRENALPGGCLRLGIEGEDILLRIEAVSFGGEGGSNPIGEGGI